jgi:hypothetical protein
MATKERFVNAALGYICYQSFLNGALYWYGTEVYELRDQIRRYNKSSAKYQHASPIYRHGRDWSLKEAQDKLAEAEKKHDWLRKFSPQCWLLGE